MKKAGKWILIFVGAIIVVLLLRGFMFTSVIIPSSGMENSLYEGDRVIVNKWSYGLRLPYMNLFGYKRLLEKPVKTGDIVVFNNPADISQPLTDWKSIFINRCIGTPGDTLKLDSMFNVSAWETAGPDRKRLFAYSSQKEREMRSLLKNLSISNSIIGSNDTINLRSFSRYEYYLIEQELGSDLWIKPFANAKEENFKPLVVPRKGQQIDLFPWNITIYRNTIVLHEGEQAEIKENTLYIQDKPVTSYTFKKDYYWMASDNNISVLDSRLFGFVPHDHVIGKPIFVWMSKVPNTDFFEGYRWNRVFMQVK